MPRRRTGPTELADEKRIKHPLTCQYIVRSVGVYSGDIPNPVCAPCYPCK
jgi:hypothetical protein